MRRTPPTSQGCKPNKSGNKTANDKTLNFHAVGDILQLGLYGKITNMDELPLDILVVDDDIEHAETVTAALEKIGVDEIKAEGEQFNPEVHNAVMHEQNDDHPENTVAEVMQKGYIKGDRIIRPAMVKVVN
jgi:hypothetical protein